MKKNDSQMLPAFARWSAAAAAGLSLMGCPDKQAEENAGATSDAGQKVTAADGADKECCFAKNECKGRGGCKTADNDCAGKNECKGKGGCNMHCPK